MIIVFHFANLFVIDYCRRVGRFFVYVLIDYRLIIKLLLSYKTLKIRQVLLPPFEKKQKKVATIPYCMYNKRYKVIALYSPT